MLEIKIFIRKKMKRKATSTRFIHAETRCYVSQVVWLRLMKQLIGMLSVCVASLLRNSIHPSIFQTHVFCPEGRCGVAKGSGWVYTENQLVATLTNKPTFTVKHSSTDGFLDCGRNQENLERAVIDSGSFCKLHTVMDHFLQAFSTIKQKMWACGFSRSSVKQQGKKD